jgi:Icc-related predicted phosphoesterase
MKILHISDTHGFHELIPLSRFDGVDMVIHSGDCSNYKDYTINQLEVHNFLEWYMNVPVKHKIYVAGNHDTSIEKRLFRKHHFEDRGITYLENEYAEIEGIKIFGSPVTPRFGDWAFMKDRGTIDRFWSKITEPMDIFVVHGPPKGVLDISYDRQNDLEMCGCSSLDRHIRRLNPSYVLFGHIHNCKDIVNTGVLHRDGIIYSNATMVEDNRFDKGLTSFGNIFEI